MNEDESPTHAFLKTLSTPESFKLGSWTTPTASSRGSNAEVGDTGGRECRRPD